MESANTKQKRALNQFLFELATNPQLQMQLTSLYTDALGQFFTAQGLSSEDAQLLINAYVSDEGKKQLAEKLTQLGLHWVHGVAEK